MRLDFVLKMSFISALYSFPVLASETLIQPKNVERSPAVIEALEPDLSGMDLTTKDLPGYTDEELAGIQDILEKAEAESDVE